MANTGNGSVDSKDFKTAVVAVQTGEKSPSLSLVRLDPRKVLLTPNSEVTVNTGITINRAMAVSAEIDSGRSVTESNESNNRRRETLSPQCTTAVKKGQAIRPAAAASDAETATAAKKLAPDKGLKSPVAVKAVAKGGESILFLQIALPTPP